MATNKPLETFNFDTVAKFDLAYEGDGRTVRAVLVPFNALPQDGRKVKFLPGSFTNTIAGRRQTSVPLFGMHPMEQLPVGHSTQMMETMDALMGEFRVSNTERGNEVLSLINDGTLHSVSVGVMPLRVKKMRGGVIGFQEVKLDHVAAVPSPAFAQAAVLEVHSAQAPDEEEEEAQLQSYQARLTVVKSSLAVARKRISKLDAAR